MINRKFSGPLGRATKFSHPRATMLVIVVMFIAANKFPAFCAIRLLDFRPRDHRCHQNIGGVRVLVASSTKGVLPALGVPARRNPFSVKLPQTNRFAHSFPQTYNDPHLCLG